MPYNLLLCPIYFLEKDSINENKLPPEKGMPLLLSAFQCERLNQSDPQLARSWALLQVQFDYLSFPSESMDRISLLEGTGI